MRGLFAGTAVLGLMLVAGVLAVPLWARSSDSPPTQYTLTISSVGSQSGSTVYWTSSTVTHGCLYPCTVTFDAGTTVQLQALPGLTSHFAGWGSDCSGDTVDPNGYSYCDVVMTSDRAVTVDFEDGTPPPFVPLTSYTLTISGPSAGSSGQTVWSVGSASHVCSYPCAFSFAAGTTVHLQAMPDPQAVFSGWGGDCRGDAVDANGYGNCDVVMTGNRNVTVAFAWVPPDDLVVQMSSTLPFATAAGEKLAVYVSVTQWADGLASSVRLDLTVPAGFTPTQAFDDQGHSCTGSGTAWSCEIGQVARGMGAQIPDRAATVTIWGIARQAGENHFSATATSVSPHESASTLANNTATLSAFVPNHATEAPPKVGKTVLLASRTKTRGCKLGANPDRRCSPGAYYSKLTTAVICASTFRTGPIRNVPDSAKHQVEIEYGLAPKDYGSTLEIDQIVSLELGGSNDVANLYPEEATLPDRAPGYHVKDKLENKLHDLVCDGTMALRSVQRQIAANWQALYKRVFGVAPVG